MSQTWNPRQYAETARFVADLGAPVVELLAPQPGERLLDLGCGDGALTAKLVALGCDVVGVDDSEPQVEAAKALGLDARVMDARALTFEAEFDAVFSNAVLHWIKEADLPIAGVWRALRPGGRFVAEFGGFRCIETVRLALIAELDARGLDGAAADPWFYPEPDAYRARLERAGFVVRTIALIPRPTPLPHGMVTWLETFGVAFASVLPADDRPGYFRAVAERVRPTLCDADGRWTADYTRLRFAADKQR